MVRATSAIPPIPPTTPPTIAPVGTDLEVEDLAGTVGPAEMDSDDMAVVVEK